jgi:hypothetical protein
MVMVQYLPWPSTVHLLKLVWKCRRSVADPLHFDAVLDPDPDPSFHKKAKNLEKVLK